jgi:hypothetical protein
MKRKMYDKLLDWKNSNEKQSLLVKGARQVGKTYIIKEFGQNEFNNLLYLNFEDQLDMRESFDEMPNPEEAVKSLQAYGVSRNIFDIEKGETLIFLDEIQLCKRAYSLIKPLTEMNRFRIVLSGSLLGVNLNGDFLDPGPTVKHLEMTPMDFEEFLWAVRGEGIKKVINNIKNDVLEGKMVNQTLHDTMNGDIKDYIIVGGMPQVVLEYTTSKDLGKVYQKQEGILTLYRSDIQQYQSTRDNKIKTLKCFDSIPNQFSKDNHRFTYSTVEEGKKARHFGNAIDWLSRTGNTRICFNIEHFKGSLIDGKGNQFKLFMNDIGLLVCMLGNDYIYKIQNNELGLFKGALYEQLLSQFLVSKDVELYYARINKYEIDFFIESKGNILPIECKSGGNTKSKSLKNYVEKYIPIKAFKISMNNVNVSDDIIKAIPHYAFAFLSFDEITSL